MEDVIAKNTIKNSGKNTFISSIVFRYKYLTSFPKMAATGGLTIPELGTIADARALGAALTVGARACIRTATVFLFTGAALSPKSSPVN